jgi:hypothetical protein
MAKFSLNLFIMHYEIKAYGRNWDEAPQFFNSALDGGERSARLSSSFTPGERAPPSAAH